MELRQLQYFLTLAEHRHFGRAAEALHIAQPSLSQQIRALEENLGVTLFDRSRRGVSLTADGEAFLPYARKILDLAGDARSELADRGGLLRGSIRLGTTPTLGAHLLPNILQRFHATHPGLELTIAESVTEGLDRELVEGRIDLALLVTSTDTLHDLSPSGVERSRSGVRTASDFHEPSEIRTPSGFVFEPLFTEDIAIALPEKHRLAKSDAVRLSELRDESFILCREGFHLRRITLEACSGAGFTPKIALTGTNVDTALRFVQAGLGVTLVPRLAADSVPRISAPRISDPPLRRTVGIAWNSDRYVSRAVEVFCAFLRHEIASARR